MTQNTNDPHTPAAAKGMTAREVDERFELARHLRPGELPADAARIRATARGNNADDAVLAELDRLPEGTYQNVTEIWTALGHGTEEAPDGSPHR